MPVRLARTPNRWQGKEVNDAPLVTTHEPPFRVGRDRFHSVPIFRPHEWSGTEWNPSLPGSWSQGAILKS
jgi:hypothetical protein